MSRSRPRRTAARERRPSAPAASPEPEDRRSLAVTVAWMLCALATLTLQLGALLSALVLASALADALPDMFRALPGVLLLSACVTSLCCLSLTPLTYRFRQSPPPRGVTAGVVVISLAPWLAAAVWHNTLAG
jgi:hypothetical protein